MMVGVADEELIPAVYAAVDPVVAAARKHGRLPHLRSTQFVDAPLVVQRAVLLVAGMSYALGDPALRLLREAGHDVASWPGWRGCPNGKRCGCGDHNRSYDRRHRPAYLLAQDRGRPAAEVERLRAQQQRLMAGGGAG